MHVSTQRSLAAFPGGSNGEFNLPPELSCIIKRGRGCRLETADGRELLDMSMGWGSVLPGHARPEIVEAMARQAAEGTNFAYVSEASLQLAEELIRLSPACEQVRFCASGTEATMYCLRLARAATRRGKVLRFEGAYHGAHDVGVANLFPTELLDLPRCRPSSAGVDPLLAESVRVAPFNDLEFAAALIEENRDDLAAIIVEPFQRCVSPAPGFLEGLRGLADRVGALLVFDEVVTGFRLAYGGAQEYYGVVPDLVAYGKALGGGVPIGAFGGRADVMSLVRESLLGSRDYVWTASTLGGNPVSCAAALTALTIYRREGTYARLFALGEKLREGMRRVLAESVVVGQVLGDGPLAQIAFTDAPPRDYRSTRHQRPEYARRVMLELFARGAFLNPMGTKFYLSLAHNEAACDEFCRRLAEALNVAGATLPAKAACSR